MVYLSCLDPFVGSGSRWGRSSELYFRHHKKVFEGRMPIIFALWIWLTGNGGHGGARDIELGLDAALLPVGCGV